MTKNLEKEREIYQNLKNSRAVRRFKDKFIVSAPKLAYAIKKAGYTDNAVVEEIIQRMIDKQYIRKSKVEHSGQYIILKWVK